MRIKSLVILLACVSYSSFSQEFTALWEKPPLLIDSLDQTPGIFLYPARDNNTGAAMVICPGGGYAMLAIDHEGHEVAKWLNSLGISAFVLTYRTGKWNEGGYRHPAPMLDGQRAMRWVRSNADKFGIKKDKIGILGFSAGGHLASTIGTHFETPAEFVRDDLDKVSSRPDFMVLVYPVISLTESYAHQGSKRFLLGKDADSELAEYLSNDKQITDETPPTFLTSTYEDTAVPVENSLSFLRGLREAGVPGAIYISTKGRHGLGLGGGETGFEQWPQVCEAWFREIGIVN